MSDVLTFPLASIIIPTFNGLRFLQTCLDALHRQTYTRHEIIVVDDASSDDTVAYLQAEQTDVRVVTLESNRGLAAACNAGAAAAQGDILVMLNNDTEVERPWLAELILPFAHPEIGSVASKMLLFDRRTVLHNTGDQMGADGIPRNRGVWEEDRGQYDQQTMVFGACGGAVAYRRAMWEEVGGFDEDLFMYLEDVDLAWRAQMAGWTARFAPRARVYHHLSATGGGVLASYYTGRNTLWVLYKNMPRALLRRYWPRIVAAQLRVAREAAWAGLRGGEAARARLRGQLDGLRTLSHLKPKRAAVQAARRVTDEEIDNLLLKS